jgi:tetratricopeptide (TPR) repeat protein
MPESRSEQLARLMRQGLDFFAFDDVEQAVRCWREVLRLDPGHREAREYLRSALGDGEEAEGPDGAAEGAEPGQGELAAEARERLRAGDLDGAFELLSQAERRDPDALEVQSLLDLVRSRLTHRYRERIGDGRQVPRVQVGPDEMLKYNLPATAGFVLSLVDGATSVEDVLALSGLDAFETLRVLSGLVDAGIVGLRA